MISSCSEFPGHKERLCRLPNPYIDVAILRFPNIPNQNSWGGGGEGVFQIENHGGCEKVPEINSLSLGN